VREGVELLLELGERVCCRLLGQITLERLVQALDLASVCG
jgi:hypothetical protein